MGKSEYELRQDINDRILNTTLNIVQYTTWLGYLKSGDVQGCINSLESAIKSSNNYINRLEEIRDYL